MKMRFVVLLVLCVFIAGVLFGVWLDKKEWRSKTGAQDIKYQVQTYAHANLAVYPGDKITLVRPDGDGTGLKINFIGYSPCVDQTPSDTCVITNTNPGPYFFTCSSSTGDKYSCPDPGIQHSPTGPLENQSEKRGAAVVAADSAVNAYVSCQQDPTTKKYMTVMQDLNGNAETTITAKQGQSVFWISSRQFTLDTHNFPAGLCSPNSPGSGPITEARCDVNMSGQNAQFVVQAEPGTCGPSATPTYLKTN
jgi:hypothetical protein